MDQLQLGERAHSNRGLKGFQLPIGHL